MVKVYRTRDGGIYIDVRDRFDCYSEAHLSLDKREFEELQEELAHLDEKETL